MPRQQKQNVPGLNKMKTLLHSKGRHQQNGRQATEQETASATHVSERDEQANVKISLIIQQQKTQITKNFQCTDISLDDKQVVNCT